MSSAVCFLLLFVFSFGSTVVSSSDFSASTSTSPGPPFIPVATACTVPSDCGLGAVCLMVNSTAGHCACPVGKLWGRKEEDGGGNGTDDDQQHQHFPFAAHCRLVSCSTDDDCWTWPNSVCDGGNSSTCICGAHYSYSSEHTACSLTAAYVVFLVFCCLFAGLLLCCTLCSCLALCCCLLLQPAMVGHGEPLKEGGGNANTKLPGGGERKSVQGEQGKGPAGKQQQLEELKTNVAIRKKLPTTEGKYGKQAAPLAPAPALQLNQSNTLRPSSPNDLAQLSEKNGVFFLNA